MFSSSLFTAKAPAPSQAKADSTQAGAEMLAEGEKTVNEQAGAFAKEFQAVVAEEQKDASEPLAESGTAGEQEQLVAAAGQSDADVTNLLNENSNTEISDTEISASETDGEPDEQISAAQKPDEQPELDSAKKQQIMSDGEALLNRLSESNKQLASSNAQPAEAEEHVPEGKILPPVNTTGPAGMLAASASVPVEAQDKVAAVPEEGATEQDPQASSSPAVNKPSLVIAGQAGTEAVAAEGASDGGAIAAQAAGSGQATLAKQENTDDDSQAAGISQEELARVFAPPATQQIASERPAGAQDSTGAVNQAVTAKGAGAIKEPLLSAELSAADAAVSDLASSERVEGKPRAGAMAIPAALATATASAPGSLGQPLATEAGQPWTSGLVNPALSTLSAGSAGAAAPELLAAGSVEAQPGGAAGVAAGSAGIAAMENSMMATEQGIADSAGEAKPAEPGHSIPGLTGLQGQANAQARAEAAQAQSPLQLSKEQGGDQLAERMQMMMSKNLKHVDIRLDPPELGKLQIKLSLNQDQASVQFTVGNQQTRDLVEQAMPRLRELLSQQGLQLAQSSVQQDSPRQQFAGQPNQQQQGQQGSGGSQHNSGTSHGQEGGSGGSEPVEMYVSQPSDRVDYYA